MLCKSVPEVGVVGLANVANGLKAAPLCRVLAATDILNQSRHQIGPLFARQLDGGDGGNKLCRRVPSSCVVACKCLKGVALDLRLDLRSKPLKPSGLNLAQASEVAGGERVLESKTGCYTDLRLGSFVCKLAGEGGQVALLCSERWSAVSLGLEIR